MTRRPRRPEPPRRSTLAVLAALALAVAGPAPAQMAGHGLGHGTGQGMHGHGQGHGHGMGHGHGADGTGHDEVTMPGLRGLNATPEESAEIAMLFRNFRSLGREVETLPNGIRTTTRSSDPAVMEALVSHVVGMIARVEARDDPQIFIQSPTLDIFFARGDRIATEIEITEAGIVVVQTSDDPELVAAMQTHAAEVTDMAERGMAAVHEAMMRRAGN